MSGGGVAQAQNFQVVSVSPNTPSFGVVGAASNGATVYTISPSGSVSVQQGSGGATSSGSTSAATVTVKCNGACSNAYAMLKLAKLGNVSGRGQAVSNFTVSSNDLAIDWVATQADGSLQVRLRGFENNTDQRVYVGMNLPILGDNASSSTSASAGWTVGINDWPNVPSLPGVNGTAVATVRKAISATTTPLSFGAIARPDQGSGTVSIDANDGSRDAGGSSPPGLRPGMSYGRGTVAVTGQPNTSFTISTPAYFQLNNGADRLYAAVTRSASGSLTLNGAGAYTLGVGGTLLVPDDAAIGAYNGVITATVSYN